MTAPKPIDIAAKLALVERQWTPHRIATFDGYQIFVAKLEGEFVWHDHAEHDEVFFPIDGVLLVDFEEGETARVEPGQFLVVPAGMRHCPRTENGECRVLVIDPQVMEHTGKERSERTVEDYPVI